MDSTSRRRWNFCALAGRWKHLLWIASVLGAVMGVWLHSSKFSHLSCGVIQIRLDSVSPSKAEIVRQDAEIRTSVFSRELLGEVVSKLKLPEHWGLEEKDCLSRLQRMIRYHSIEGTALKAITVRGRDSAESLTVCSTVIEEIRERFSEPLIGRSSDKSALLKAAVARQEATANRTRAELSEAMRFDTPQQNRRFATAKTDFEQASRALYKLKIREAALEMELKVQEDPIIVHEWPSASLPQAMWGLWTCSLLGHFTLGLTAGGLVVVVSLPVLERVYAPQEAPRP